MVKKAKTRNGKRIAYTKGWLVVVPLLSAVLWGTLALVAFLHHHITAAYRIAGLHLLLCSISAIAATRCVPFASSLRLYAAGAFFFTIALWVSGPCCGNHSPTEIFYLVPVAFLLVFIYSLFRKLIRIEHGSRLWISISLAFLIGLLIFASVTTFAPLSIAIAYGILFALLWFFLILSYFAAPYLDQHYKWLLIGVVLFTASIFYLSDAVTTHALLPRAIAVMAWIGGTTTISISLFYRIFWENGRNGKKRK